MRVTKNTQIAGLRGYRVREALKSARRNVFWPICSDCFFLSDEETLAACERLVAEGYLVLVQDLTTSRLYKPTNLGDALSRAVVPKPLTLVEALDLLGRTVGYFRAINHNEELLYRVTDLQIEGELVSGNRATVSHIELAVTLVKKPPHAVGYVTPPAGISAEDFYAAAELRVKELLTTYHPSVCFIF